MRQYSYPFIHGYHISISARVRGWIFLKIRKKGIFDGIHFSGLRDLISRNLWIDRHELHEGESIWVFVEYVERTLFGCSNVISVFECGYGWFAYQNDI